VILIQQGVSQPQSDLADVLLRWERSGIDILVKETTANDLPTKITIRGPNPVAALVDRVLASLGFGRGSVGGFGSSVGDFIRVG